MNGKKTIAFPSYIYPHYPTLYKVTHDKCIMMVNAFEKF